MLQRVSVMTELSDSDQLIRMIMELRKRGIRDHRLLSAMESVPRLPFIPKMFAGRAYEDVSLPISAGQMISSPYLVAAMLDELECDERSIVLDIGTGSGYVAALLSKIARRVYTIEHHPELRLEAEERFQALHTTNITSIHADGLLGWPDAAPYDRIIVNGSVNAVPTHLLEQLADGGTLLMPVGAAATGQKLFKISKDGDVYHRSELAIETYFDALIHS